MDLKPIKTKRIYEEIIEQIRILVTEGHLHPGDRLPSERDLAEQLNVSRASVREALSALELMGLLEIRSGEGTFIKKINIEAIITPLAWVLSMEKDDIIELLEVRKMIEVQAVALAAMRAEPENLRELEAYLNTMIEDLKNERLGEDADLNFHYAIAKASQNKILIRLMNAISDTMHQTLKASRIKLYEGEGMLERLNMEHSQVFQAVQSRNVELASTLMMKHLAGVEKELLSKA